MMKRLTLVVVSFAIANLAVADGVLPVVTPADAETHGLRSLRIAKDEIPTADLSQFMNSGAAAETAMLQLGKIAFWDQQMGSSGLSGDPGQACASCHFHAGADSRATNQVSPGLNRLSGDTPVSAIIGLHYESGDPDTTFEVKQPGETLEPSDFPFVKAPGDPDSPLNSNDVSSSQGVVNSRHLRSVAGVADDVCRITSDSVFNTIHGQVRKVEPRNTPSVINAFLNGFFLFWDGRANPFYNGVNPFGVQDPDAHIFKSNGVSLDEETIEVEYSQLASQASGPPLSDFEGSCAGRIWADIGRKLFSPNAGTGVPLVPLARQVVHPEDSVLGGMSLSPAMGVSTTYADLIMTAFKSEYWDGGDNLVIESRNDGLVAWNPADGNPPRGQRYTLMEANASLFIPLAIQTYELTLVSDRSHFDRWLESGRFRRGFTETELSGLNVFVDKAGCINCHGGPELTNASTRNAQAGSSGNPQNVIEPMVMGNNETGIYDNGFYNLAVKVTQEDIGRGGRGPTGAPLASARQRLFEENAIESIPFRILSGDHVPAIAENGDPVCIDNNSDGFCDQSEPINPAFQRVAVDGAFKTPGLRNSALTGPYFHAGNYSTLRQVVEFYDNGGNFCQKNRDNFDADIHPLGLTDQEKTDLVAFIVSMTDPRVENESAPFDHPSLTVAMDGYDGGTNLELPAVGRYGLRRERLPRIGTFLGLDPNDPGGVVVDFECSPTSEPEAEAPL